MTTVSIAAASLSDSLPTSVPKLEATELNWVIFLVRFRDAVEAKGYWGHFDGSLPAPSLSTPPTTAETTAKGQWDKEERSTKSLLTQKLPDSTLMKVHAKATVRGEVDGCGQGVHRERGVCADGFAREVLGIEMF
jgi:hypothetical protein